MNKGTGELYGDHVECQGKARHQDRVDLRSALPIRSAKIRCRRRHTGRGPELDRIEVSHPVWPESVYPNPVGIIGGLIGGLGVALVGAGYGLVNGVGIWLPFNLVAAAVLRQLQSQPLNEIGRFNLLACWSD